MSGRKRRLNSGASDEFSHQTVSPTAAYAAAQRIGHPQAFHQHDRQKAPLDDSMETINSAISCWTPAQQTHDPPENLLAGIIWREKGSCTQKISQLPSG